MPLVSTGWASLFQVFRGLKLVIQFPGTPGNWSAFWLLTCWGKSGRFSVPLGGKEAGTFTCTMQTEAAGHRPGILVVAVQCREQCTDPGQHSRHWNHQLWEPSPRRIEFGIVSRVGDASPVSVCLVPSVFVQMWKALPLHLPCTPTNCPLPPSKCPSSCYFWFQPQGKCFTVAELL